MVSISNNGARPHDPDLVDRLAELVARQFEGDVWRATRLSQDPIAFSNNGGRWAPPSTFQSVPVLYTSFERNGAVMEMASWLSNLQPRPSKPIVVHRLVVRTSKVVALDLNALSTLGIDHRKYSDRAYAAMGEEPPSRSQEIGAALSFLGIDGLIVPSARYACNNLILFDNSDNEIEIDDAGSEEVDWIKFIDD